MVATLSAPMRPRASAVTTALMCLTNFCGFFLIPWKLRSAPVLFVFYSIVIAAGYVVLYFFWTGRNWARWMVLLTCILCFWNVWRLRVPVAAKYYSPVRAPMVLAEGLIAIYLVVYLNTPQAKAFFSRATLEAPKGACVRKEPGVG